MKKIRLANIMIVVSMGVVGCVSGKVNYIPPTGVQEKNSIILQQSMDEVWTKMIDGIGDSFFVINNIEKDSGLINVSYSNEFHSSPARSTLLCATTKTEGLRPGTAKATPRAAAKGRVITDNRSSRGRPTQPVGYALEPAPGRCEAPIVALTHPPRYLLASNSRSSVRSIRFQKCQMEAREARNS